VGAPASVRRCAFSNSSPPTSAIRTRDGLYYRAAEEFLTWCATTGAPSIAPVQPVHVASWIEASPRELAAPSVKQQLAALRHLFDWLVKGQVCTVNPAHMVRGRLREEGRQAPRDAVSPQT
jgi:site-specific recombinase XerC